MSSYKDSYILLRDSEIAKNNQGLRLNAYAWYVCPIPVVNVAIDANLNIFAGFEI